MDEMDVMDEMDAARGEFRKGQLCREVLGSHQVHHVHLVHIVHIVH